MKAAQSDVDRMHAMLLRHSSWAQSPITPLQGSVSARHIDAAIADMVPQLGAGDFVLVYYAGHAGTHGAEYVLHLPAEVYPITRLIDAFTTTPLPITSLMLIDACFAERAARHAFMEFLHDLGARPQTSQTSSILHTRVVIAASAADQPARERDSGGIVTSAFLEAAEHGGKKLEAAVGGIVDIPRLNRCIEQSAGPRQQVKTVVYGSGFDVKTTLLWRLEQGGRREYPPKQFLMLEEDTHVWYATAGPQTELISAFWSGDPLTIALGFRDQPVQVLQLRQADRTVIPLAELPTMPVSRGIKVSSAGDQVAIISAEGKVLVYPASGGTRPLREYPIRPGQFVITAQNMLVASAAPTGEIEVWPLGRNDSVARSGEANLRAVNHLRALPDGSAVVTGSAEPGEALMWDLSSINPNARTTRVIDVQRIRTEPVGRLDKPFGEAQRVAISPDGRLIAVGFGGMPGRVRIWHSEDLSRPISTLAYPEHKSFISALEFSPDSSMLASGCAGGEVYITSLTGGRAPRLVRASRTGSEWVTALAFAPLGQDPTLVIGTMSGQVETYVLARTDGVPVNNSGQRGEVYRLGILADRSHPLRIIIAAKHGLECWDFVQ